MEEPHTVVTYGLTDEEHALVERSLPGGCTAYATSAPSDLVVHGDVAAVVRAAELDECSLEFLTGYYEACDAGLAGTVAWIGEPAPLRPLPAAVRRFATFGELAPVLERLLRQAEAGCRRADGDSRRLAGIVRTLMLIRAEPGISTRRLAEDLGTSPSSIRRYIAALRMAGEWVECDRGSGGWRLPCGSLLLDDPLGQPWR